jgi:hypothetical protein
MPQRLPGNRTKLAPATSNEVEARDENQRRTAVSPFKTIKALKSIAPPPTDPRDRATWDRYVEGISKAGLPDE